MDWQYIIATMLVGAGLDHLGHEIWAAWKEHRRLKAELDKEIATLIDPLPVSFTAKSPSAFLDREAERTRIAPAKPRKPARPRKPRKRT